MQKILVPTDFSDNALKAVAHACEIAKKSNAVIHLLHVEPTLSMATMQADPSAKKWLLIKLIISIYRWKPLPTCTRM
jgi:nucleotide-binding universal stress UspA family protein